MMRLRCIKAKTDASEGFLGIGAHGPKPIEGLTEGKFYDGAVLNKLSGGGNISVTNNYKFLIYNDNRQWRTYDISLFAPEEM